ncbi:MAG: hypothetical protein JW810_10750 [Sedimentisphaerales bacterium]|nr:hypothetical protein [Sedimentisphaerales bacterium]
MKSSQQDKAEPEEGASACRQGGQSLNDKKTAPKPYWLATVSALCFLAFPVLGITITIIMACGIKVKDSVGVFVGLFAFVLLTASPIIAILALLKIYRSNGVLVGARQAIIVIVGSCIILTMTIPVVSMDSFNRGRRSVCTANLKELGEAMKAYASDHDGMIPALEDWCDVLATETEVSLVHFVCRPSEAQYGESSYALNRNIAGWRLSDLPPEMVLLFEAKYDDGGAERDFPLISRDCAAHVKDARFREHQSDIVYQNRWNQSGGPEALAVDNHEPRGCNILFVGGHVEYVALRRLPELRWKVEGDETFPSHLLPAEKGIASIQYIAVALVGVSVLTATVIILRKYQVTKHPVFSLVVGLSSAGVGCLFGFLAETMYPTSDVHNVGIVAGGALGFLVGICYAAILRTSCSTIRPEGCKGYAASLGMAAGILCSTLVHLVLTIMHEEYNPNGMVGGLPFGILAGAVLGAISGVVVRDSYPPEAVEG